ncbi:hypothetical protein [Desulfovibrio sp. ZJ369]|uniref:hypothetical protein n=1 Tax=Desulfovibrio sp. ZJ369 TaxID=2709793 RepID=UPI00197F4E71|nr:hypothetical protein [Desulfovibrio sp. ZJ369]
MPNRTKPQRISLRAVIIFAFLFAFGYLLRFYFFPAKFFDYTMFLNKWYLLLQKNGFSAFSQPFSDYTYLYLYYLYFLAKFDINSLYGIKFLSIIFDSGLAILTYRILRMNSSQLKSLAGSVTVFLLPTCFTNGAIWGQCDSIYTFFLLLSVYFLLKRQGLKACLAFSLAFSLKLQSVFILPTYALLFLFPQKRAEYNIKKWYFLLPPAIYIIIALPTLFAGNSPSYVFLFKTFYNQIHGYTDLTLNAPTIWAFFSKEYMHPIVPFLSLPGIVAISFLFYTLFLSSKNNHDEILPLVILTLTTLSIFLLPRMHERYFYFSDIFSVVIAYYYWKPALFLASACIITASFTTYCNVLFGTSATSIKTLTLLMALAILILISTMLQIRWNNHLAKKALYRENKGSTLQN